ncbi:MAG: ACT domain-containing protein [Chitinophagaceae bacterium]
MGGETNLQQLLATMQPVLCNGDYVFCTIASLQNIDQQKIIGFFKEAEGYTIILEKKEADALLLKYSFVAAWITLTVHSSLEAVGLTAAFSSALTAANISCNVLAAFYHDHIYVNQRDAGHALQILNRLAADAAAALT